MRRQTIDITVIHWRMYWAGGHGVGSGCKRQIYEPWCIRDTQIHCPTEGGAINRVPGICWWCNHRIYIHWWLWPKIYSNRELLEVALDSMCAAHGLTFGKYGYISRSVIGFRVPLPGWLFAPATCHGARGRSLAVLLDMWAIGNWGMYDCTSTKTYLD